MASRFDRDLGNGWRAEVDEEDGTTLVLLNPDGEMRIWLVHEDVNLYADESIFAPVPFAVMRGFFAHAEAFFKSLEYRAACARMSRESRRGA